jgi:hypothetical protein
MSVEQQIIADLNEAIQNKNYIQKFRDDLADLKSLLQAGNISESFKACEAVSGNILASVYGKDIVSKELDLLQQIWHYTLGEVRKTQDAFREVPLAEPKQPTRKRLNLDLPPEVTILLANLTGNR